LDTMLWGLAVFFYSNFLPDLPSIYRKKPKTMMRKTFHGISATPYYCLRRCSYGFYFQVYA
jgi:hypothetical protein